MNYSVFFIAVIYVVAAGAFLGKTRYKDCGSRYTKIVSVDVENCKEFFPCPLRKGVNTTVTMEFTIIKNVTGVINYAFGYIGPIRTPFPLDDYDACHFMPCPLVAGTTVTYTNHMFVPPSYPNVECE